MPAPLSSHISALQQLERGLGQQQCESLAIWLSLMQQAGKVMNLTGLDSAEQMARELVDEALRLHDIAVLPEGSTVLDIGSGNGSPVMPLAVLNPQCSFSAVDSRQRRTDFLSFAKARMRLGNLKVICSRVEQLPADQSGPFDIVLSRAFAAPAEFIRIAAGLITESGEIRGMGGEDAAAQLEAAAIQHGLEVSELQQYEHAQRQRCVYRLTRSN